MLEVRKTFFHSILLFFFFFFCHAIHSEYLNPCHRTPELHVITYQTWRCLSLQLVCQKPFNYPSIEATSIFQSCSMCNIYSFERLWLTTFPPARNLATHTVNYPWSLSFTSYFSWLIFNCPGHSKPASQRSRAALGVTELQGYPAVWLTAMLRCLGFLSEVPRWLDDVLGGCG